MLTRRNFLGTAAAGIALRAQPANRCPNILILLADDLGYADVGVHGSRAQTPNIDKLARIGVQIEKFYVAPVCSPCRAGLLTGRSQVRYGLLNVIPPFTKFGLPTDEHILPETFKAAGYQTAMMGKWHLGHWHQKYFPHNRGFDHFYGHLNGFVDYFTHEREGGIDWQRNGKTVVEEGYTTDLLAAEAIRWIKGRDKSRPFLLYLPFNAPHAPLQAPKALIDKYGDIADEKKRTYAAMVDGLDTAIGRVLASLDQEGIRENTLVLFFSDNGGPIDEGATNTPLRAGKGHAFEGGIRSIAVFEWRGKLPGGRKLAQSMSVLDVFPTLCAAAGVTPRNTKPFDGENMWPVITSGKTRPHSNMYFAIDHFQWGFQHRAVIQGNWKLVITKTIKGENPANLLFRLDLDPNERNDLSSAEERKTKELARLIEEWYALLPAEHLRPSGRPPGLTVPPRWAEAAVKD